MHHNLYNKWCMRCSLPEEILPMKNYILKIILLFFFLTLSPLSSFANGNFIYNVEVGRGIIDISEDYCIDGSAHDYVTSDMTLRYGYQFNSGVMIETGYTYHLKDSLHEGRDVYKFKGYQLLAGFQIMPDSPISITPKIGLINWELKSEYNRSSTHGEKTKDRHRGNDLMYSLSIGYDANDKIYPYLNYTRTDCNFGKVYSVGLGIKVEI